MYDDEIIKMSAWLNATDRCFETGRVDDDFYVNSYDIDDFCDFIRENFPDLIGIPCMIHGTGIWFKLDDLKNAHYA